MLSNAFVFVFQLEKLQALGYRAILLIAKPKKKTGSWKVEALTPSCQLTDTSAGVVKRIGELYTHVVKGKVLL